MNVGFVSTYPPVVSGLSDYSEKLVDYLNCNFKNIRITKISSLKNINYPFIKNIDVKKFDLLVYNIGNHPYNENAYLCALENPGIAVLHETNIQDLIRHISQGENMDIRHLLIESIEDDISKKSNDLYNTVEHNFLTELIDAGNMFVVHSNSGFEMLRNRYGCRRVMMINEYVIINERKIEMHDKRIGVFGYISYSKACDRIVDSFKRYSMEHKTSLKLLFAGNIADFDLKKKLNDLNLGGSVEFIENPNDEAFEALINRVDYAINLRVKSGGETSMNMLKLLAGGAAVASNSITASNDIPTNCYVKIEIDRIENDLFDFFKSIDVSPEKYENIREAGKMFVIKNNDIKKVAVSWIDLFMNTKIKKGRRKYYGKKKLKILARRGYKNVNGVFRKGEG